MGSLSSNNNIIFWVNKKHKLSTSSLLSTMLVPRWLSLRIFPSPVVYLYALLACNLCIVCIVLYLHWWNDFFDRISSGQSLQRDCRFRPHSIASQPSPSSPMLHTTSIACISWLPRFVFAIMCSPFCFCQKSWLQWFSPNVLGVRTFSCERFQHPRFLGAEVKHPTAAGIAGISTVL